MEHNTIEETLNGIISSALKAHASDIHIDPGENSITVFFRIDGTLNLHNYFPLSMHEGIIIRIKVLARLRVDDNRLPKDGRFKWQGSEGQCVEVRVSMMPTSYGENAVLRLFDPLVSAYSLKELGFTEEHSYSIEKALTYHSGIIMLVGPTGSGKTTTLYSLLHHLKKTSRLIITVEDPVERRIEGVRQIEVGGTTFLEYVTVLRSIVRQDPDVIMIGEIRDKESAELAIQAALTGHLVITTLHTASVFQIKKRLMYMGISEFMIDATLISAASQRLVMKICPRCKVEDVPVADYEKYFVLEHLHRPKNIYKGAGCEHCKGTGFEGRIVVSELLEEGLPLYVDAFRKASLGLIPFSEVMVAHNEYRHEV